MVVDWWRLATTTHSSNRHDSTTGRAIQRAILYARKTAVSQMTERPPQPSATIRAVGRTGVVSNGIILTAGAMAQAAVGVGAQLILMRLLVPDAFGNFATILAGTSLAQVILSLRLNILIIRVTDAELEAKRDCFQAALVWETAAAAAVTLIWLAGAGLLTAYALVVVASLAIGQWTNQMVAFYERTMAYRRMVAVETGSQLVGHLTAVALVFAGFGAASLYLRELTVALMRLGAFSRIGALARPRFRLPRRHELNALIGDVRELWIDGVMEGGFARLIVLVAAFFGGPHGAGIFVQSQRLAIVPHQVLAPVVLRMSANLFSRIGDAAARHRLLVKMLLLTLICLVPAAGLTVAFADPVLPLGLGEQWRPAADVLVAMIGVIVFFPAFELLRAYCLTQRRTGLVLGGRVVQYAVFLIAAALAVRGSDPIWILASGLSAAYAGAFAVVAAGLAFQRPVRATVAAD